MNFKKKADKYKYKAEKRDYNASEAKTKYMRANLKAEKWIKAMDKVFADYDVDSLRNNNELIYNGKKYVDEMLDD